jgi:glycosyltransferase involved in cell wall biosynthesis
MIIVSCIIPFFNEKDRIQKVLEDIVKAKTIDEIICVDDGSTDGGLVQIQNKFPEIKTIRISKNIGKADAVKHGLKLARGKYILLVDGDLRDLDHNEVENALQEIINNETIDMIVLRRVRTSPLIKLIRSDILASGERIIRKTDIENVLNNQKLLPRNYELEFAINKYMLDNLRNVFWMPLSARNTYKTWKMNLFRAVYETAAESVEIVHFIGLKDYAKQLLFFCKNSLDDRLDVSTR